MRNSILFICNEQNFLVRSFLNSITDAGFTITLSKPDSTELLKIPRIPEIIILYLDGVVTGFNGTFEFLEKTLSVPTPERVLFFIGTKSEIEVSHEYMPQHLITHEFTRPVNINNILEQLQLVQDQSKNPKPRKKILIVDDDMVVLRTMHDLFSKTYEVYMANSGAQALAFFAQNTVDVILLDYEMPVVSGLQVFEMLRNEQKTASIPVIFLTAKDTKDIVMKVIAAKPQKYLLKTLPTETLLHTVDEFLKGK